MRILAILLFISLTTTTSLAYGKTVYYFVEYTSGAGGGNPENVTIVFNVAIPQEDREAILYQEMNQVIKYFHPKKQMMGSTYDHEDALLPLRKGVSFLVYDPTLNEIRPMIGFKDPFK